jgi:hypothetical protein
VRVAVGQGSSKVAAWPARPLKKRLEGRGDRGERAGRRAGKILDGGPIILGNSGNRASDTDGYS